MRRTTIGSILALALVLSETAAWAQSTAASEPALQPASAGPATALPPGYVIGPQDILSIVFWREKELSAEVTVRPDGKISIPLLNDVQAAGSTPEELRLRLIEAAGQYIEDPSATVVVKEIHSRNVFITGNVARPATYPLNVEMNVLQLIAMAGGLLEYADSKNVVVLRTENGQSVRLPFNYRDVIRGRQLEQNVRLKPGDTVVVP